MRGVLMKPKFLNDNSNEHKLQKDFTAVLGFNNHIQEHLVMYKQKDIWMPWEAVTHNIPRKYRSPQKASLCSYESTTSIFQWTGH